MSKPLAMYVAHALANSKHSENVFFIYIVIVVRVFPKISTSPFKLSLIYLGPN